jgi:hypothetical protein
MGWAWATAGLAADSKTPETKGTQQLPTKINEQSERANFILNESPHKTHEVNSYLSLAISTVSLRLNKIA